MRRAWALEVGILVSVLLGACGHNPKSQPTMRRVRLEAQAQPALTTNAAPPEPSAFTATPVTPFAVRLRWQVGGGAVAGYEISVERDGKPVLVALVAPSAREFDHHFRLPETSYRYSLRSFNAQGSSPETSATARTPGTVPNTATTTEPPPACTRLPPAVDPPSGSPRELLSAPDAPQLYNDPEPNEAFRRHLLGEYLGCWRDFGQFLLQGQEMTPVPGHSDEGFPLLRAIEGAGIEGAQRVTLQFARGRYTVVDRAQFCGESALEAAPAPPIEACQRDFE